MRQDDCLFKAGRTYLVIGRKTYGPFGSEREALAAWQEYERLKVWQRATRREKP